VDKVLVVKLTESERDWIVTALDEARDGGKWADPDRLETLSLYLALLDGPNEMTKREADRHVRAGVA
jgi:hypothetical protein